MWFKSFTLGALLLIAGLMGPAYAQKKNAVIAKVSGGAITQSDIDIFAKENVAYLSRFPAKQRRQKVIERLIDQTLLARAALDAKLHESNTYNNLITYYERRALSESFVFSNVFPKVTDDRLKAQYDTLIKNAPKVDEVRVRHILVNSQTEAEAVVKELKNGADFAEYARVRSRGPSAKLGGDLGYITEVFPEKAIATTAFKLKKDQISAPVQTKLGWHVLKLEDRRKRKLQEYKDIKGQLRNIVLRNEMNDTVKKLRKTAKIEYVDPKAKPKKGK